MVILVTGAAGQLGQALQYLASKHPEHQFIFASSSELNITDESEVNTFFGNNKIDYCINAAAYTAVDKAETEIEKAIAVNVKGPEFLAKACQKTDAVLIHISTDFVFDGNGTKPYKEEDQTHPLGVYGQTKLEGEKAIQQYTKKYFILRTSWVYSQYGANFMKTMLRLSSERDSLNVVADQIGTPTHAVDLAEVILNIIAFDIEDKNKTSYGVYHFSNDGVCSWYDFAVEIFKVNQISIQVNPIPTKAYPTPAQRPKYSVLDKTKITKTFGISIQTWQDALAKRRV